MTQSQAVEDLGVQDRETADPTGGANAEGLQRRLKKSMMVGWGLGSVAPGMIIGLANALQLRFITDFVGISAGVASTILVLSKLYDAFADPTMGWLSDRTQSRWGRRRPYLLLGGILLPVAMVLMFTLPPFDSTVLRIGFTFVVALLFTTAYTIFNIPYIAMPAEMSFHRKERTELISYRVYAIGISQMLAQFCGSALVQKMGGTGIAYTKMALILAPITLVCSLLCFRMTRGVPATVRVRSKVTIGVQIRSAIGNRPYLVLLVAKLFTLMTLASSAVLPFFFGNVLGKDMVVLGSYFALLAGSFVISQPLWVWVSNRWSKATTYRAAVLIAIPFYLTWLWAAHGEPLSLIYARAFIIGFLAGGALLAGQALLPDTIEYDYLVSGLRREGIFAGFYTTMEKVSGAVGIGIVGVLLSHAGYVASRGAAVVQPHSALIAIRYIVAVLPAVLSLLCFLVLLFYNLTDEKINDLRRGVVGSR